MEDGKSESSQIQHFERHMKSRRTDPEHDLFINSEREIEVQGSQVLFAER